MKNCSICEKPFPNSAVVDGRVVWVNSRKNCLDCVPFGQSLKGPHESRLNPIRTCTTCDKTYKFNRNCSLDLCQQCRRKAFTRGRKLKLLKLFGCRCSRCGYDKSAAALEFHHVDRDTKKFGIGQGYGKRFEVLVAEAEKCVILCANCHRELHGSPDLQYTEAA